MNTNKLNLIQSVASTKLALRNSLSIRPRLISRIVTNTPILILHSSFHTSLVLFSDNDNNIDNIFESTNRLLTPQERATLSNENFISSPNDESVNQIMNVLRNLNTPDSVELRTSNLEGVQLPEIHGLSHIIGRDTLRNSADIIPNNSADNTSDPWENSSSQISSFSESFPNYSDEDNHLLQIVKKGYNFNKDELLAKMQNEGVVSGVFSVIKNSRRLVSNQVEDKTDIRSQIVDLTHKMEDIDTRLKNTEEKLDGIIAVQDKIDTALQTSYGFVQMVARNQGNIDNIVTLATLLSPLLLYRGFLRLNLKAYAYTEKIDLNQLSDLARTRYLTRRSKIIKVFNCVFIPLVVGLTLWKTEFLKDITLQIKGHIQVNVDSPVDDKSNQTSLNLIPLGFMNKHMHIILTVFLLTLNYLILPYLQKYYPFIYDKIIECLYIFLPYLGIYLLSIVYYVTLLSLIELVFSLYFISNKAKISIHRYWPSFIHKYFNDLFEESRLKFSERKFLMNLKIRAFIVNSLLSISLSITYLLVKSIFF